MRSKIKIKRFDKSLPLPKFHSNGAVAFDLYSREAVTIESMHVDRITTNISVKVPDGYMLLIRDKSGFSYNNKCIVIGGIIDQDYHGPNDEILVQLLNLNDKDVTIRLGERIAQAIFVRIDNTFLWDEVDNISNSDRGGFGSTGDMVKLEDDKIGIEGIMYFGD